MKHEKLIFISCIALFVLCILMSVFNRKNEEIENEISTEVNEMGLEELQEFQDSEFNYDEVSFVYEDSELNMETILNENEQLSYFQFTVYNYLVERGYSEVTLIEVGRGIWYEEHYIKFNLQVYSKDESLVQVNVEYDTQLLAFFYYFEESKLEAQPVTLIDVDEELAVYLREVQEEMEKKLGEYIFEEKLEATKASVKWYEEDEGTLVIQLELQDEYLTYCKIYFNLESKQYEFKKWD